MNTQTDLTVQTGFNPTLEETICTIYEKDYHLGLAAFINSLAQNGYRGTVWIGHRDALPPWIAQLKPHTPVKVGEESIETYLLEGKVRLAFVRIDPPCHLANFKPQFMLEIFRRYATECEYLWYFDPDIFIVSSWNYFEQWQQCGIALCADINFTLLPDNSPLRCRWKKFAESIGLNNVNVLTQYFNSGVVAAARNQIEFIELWAHILQGIEKSGHDLSRFHSGDREALFDFYDQDAFNIAAMYTKMPLSPQGRWAMGFEPGSTVMYHTVGPKPWRGTLKRALQGHAPSNGARYFFKQAAGPIRPYSSTQLFLRKTACSIASFIGRFYDRPIH